MQNRAKVITRRIAVATAGVAVAAAGWAFNLPADAAASPACPQLIASYLANPASRPRDTLSRTVNESNSSIR